jgi:hypothetical protein
LSAGHTVKKLPAVALTVVTLSTAPVAVGDRPTQFPKLPRAVIVSDSPCPRGVLRAGVAPVGGPAGLVSRSRQGVIAVNVDEVPPAALAHVISPPAPMLTATAAPMADQRAR